MNLGNIQTDTTVRIAAVICIVLGFIASLVVMAVEYIANGSATVLPPLVNTVITSVLTFAVAALSSHQGAQIQQSGNSTGAATVQDTTLKAASALEKVVGANGTKDTTQAAQTQATIENTIATEANTQATNVKG